MLLLKGNDKWEITCQTAFDDCKYSRDLLRIKIRNSRGTHEITEHDRNVTHAQNLESLLFLYEFSSFMNGQGLAEHLHP